MKNRGVSLAKQARGREGSEGGRFQIINSSAAEGAKEERVGCAKKLPSQQLAGYEKSQYGRGAWKPGKKEERLDS